MPVREYLSDCVRLLRQPFCSPILSLHAAVAAVLKEREVTPEKPLRLAEVGTNLGDCIFNVIALLGADCVQAFAIEPFPAAARRIPETTAANGFNIQTIAAAVGPSIPSELKIQFSCGNNIILVAVIAAHFFATAHFQRALVWNLGQGSIEICGNLSSSANYFVNQTGSTCTQAPMNTLDALLKGESLDILFRYSIMCRVVRNASAPESRRQ